MQVVAAFAAWMAIFLPSAFCFWRMHNTFGAGKVIAINVSRSVMTLVAIGVAMKFKLQPAGFFVTLACVQTSFLLALKGVAPRQ
ncbi:MAG TPA: hypothetical protein DER02_11175 [Gammaproteobacteria bacterium]|nr:hypothetical protein [Gammaproteobacteria bacterium]